MDGDRPLVRSFGDHVVQTKPATDDGSTKLNDCVTQEVPGYTIEACMCTDNLCNGGDGLALHSLALLLVPTIALLVATA